MTREERLAANEARFRQINESAQPQRERSGSGRFVCECSDNSCARWITLAPERYEEVRRHPRHFIVWPGHEIPDVETIVRRCDGYFVIEKPEDVQHVLDDNE